MEIKQYKICKLGVESKPTGLNVNNRGYSEANPWILEHLIVPSIPQRIEQSQYKYSTRFEVEESIVIHVIPGSLRLSGVIQIQACGLASALNSH